MERRARPGRAPRMLLAGVLVALLVLGGFGLALAAAPLAGLPGDATRAREALGRAEAAVERGDLVAARTAVARARREVDAARARTSGAGRSVLAAVPVFGSAVSDARHLVGALDHATTVAATGIEVYAPLAGDGGRQLFRDGRFDLGVLAQVVDGAGRIGREADAAQRELDRVEGTAPLVGGRIREARDAAAARIEPMAEGYRRARPVIEALPRMLGADGEASYLIALMNPGELRWSGGMPLAFSTATVRQGRAEFGETRDMTDIPERWRPRPFPPVRGNPFHTNRLPRSTFHPDWAISGRELLASWGLATGEDPETVVALDVPAIAELLRVTGPVQVPVYGRVTADNLVRLQAQSYDRVDDVAQRKNLNKLLVAAVRERLLSGENGAGIVRAMYAAAQERHLAIVSSDERLDRAFVRAQMGGRLPVASQDYLSAFSMSLGGSKAGYRERRTLSLRVRLAPDGSARVRVDVRLLNDAPPYRGSGEDPGRGYQTRWTNLQLLQVLPRGATGIEGDLSGRGSAEATLGGRPWVRQDFELPPNEPVNRSLSYTVPRAARVSGDTMTYRLAYDPQGMVHPQQVRVRVVFPEGYDADALPAGWRRTDDGAAVDAGALRQGTQWTIRLTRG